MRGIGLLQILFSAETNISYNFSLQGQRGHVPTVGAVQRIKKAIPTIGAVQRIKKAIIGTLTDRIVRYRGSDRSRCNFALEKGMKSVKSSNIAIFRIFSKFFSKFSLGNGENHVVLTAFQSLHHMLHF